MRKILTQEERKKKVRRNQIIVGIILIGIMIFSVLGYALSGKEEDKIEKIEYNGIEFVENSGYWYFNAQGQNFVTRYNPDETKDISFFSYLSIADYSNKPLYFIGDAQEPILEIGSNLNPFVLRSQDACLEKMNCSGDYPVKNCSLDNTIIFRETDENSRDEKIYQDENCVFISASLGNQTRYADAFLFKILGI